MKKIVLILPRGEAIKNFVYSGIVARLRENYHVTFFSVVPNKEIKDYLISNCDDFYELQETISKNKFASEILQVLQIAHAKKLNSYTGNLKILKDDLLSKRSLKSRIVRKLRKLLAFFYASQDSLVGLTNYYIRKNFTNKQVLFYEEILKDIKPHIVFNTSHIHNQISLDLMYATKKLKIKTMTFLFSWDNLTSQGRIIPNYDYYCTWSNKIKKDLVTYYPKLDSEKVFVTGTPQFDFHFNEEYIWSKEKLYDFLKLPKDKKIVLYSTGMAYYTPKEHIVVEEIAKVLKRIDKSLQLVVRIYAKDDNTVYYKMRDKDKTIVIPDHYWEINHLTPTIKDITLFNSLLNHCSIGINVASTVSLELAILNKPIINIAFNPPGENIYPNDYEKIYEFDHYKPIIKSGAISLVKTTDDLEEQIRLYLKQPNFKNKERQELVKQFFGKELKEDKKEIFSTVFSQILK